MKTTYSMMESNLRSLWFNEVSSRAERLFSHAPEVKSLQHTSVDNEKGRGGILSFYAYLLQIHTFLFVTEKVYVKKKSKIYIYFISV